MEGNLDRKCSRCNKIKCVDEFTEPNKLCNICIEYNKSYYRNKRDGIEITKEPKTMFEDKIHHCEICKYDIKLCKKAQHEKSLYHLDRLNRIEHPENYENEETPLHKIFINGK